jgi:hypothetical protein
VCGARSAVRFGSALGTKRASRGAALLAAVLPPHPPLLLLPLRRISPSLRLRCSSRCCARCICCCKCLGSARCSGPYLSPPPCPAAASAHDLPRPASATLSHPPLSSCSLAHSLFTSALSAAQPCSRPAPRRPRLPRPAPRPRPAAPAPPHRPAPAPRTSTSTPSAAARARMRRPRRCCRAFRPPLVRAARAATPASAAPRLRAARRPRARHSAAAGGQLKKGTLMALRHHKLPALTAALHHARLDERQRRPRRTLSQRCRPDERLRHSRHTLPQHCHHERRRSMLAPICSLRGCP